MTNDAAPTYSIEHFGFDPSDLAVAEAAPKLANWPVVYVLNGARAGQSRGHVYVGESTNFVTRMHQHLKSDTKVGLDRVEVVVDDTFNKSVCLDLESHLIRFAAGDGTNEVLNGNAGIVDADYYDRERYRAAFDDIYEELRDRGLFSMPLADVINSELFKYSPFKALNVDQRSAVFDIMEVLAEDFGRTDSVHESMIVSGGPGTGKTIVAIFLLKLLADLGQNLQDETDIPDSEFSGFFVEGIRERFENLRIAFVIPQQALRTSVGKVFSRTPGLDASMVLSPFDVGKADGTFDLLIVDEAHRLTRYASQAHGTLTADFRKINHALFDGKQPEASQLDWLVAKSRNLILMLDADQSVRPRDLTRAEIECFRDSLDSRRTYELKTQMRAMGGEDYIEYVHDIFSADPPTTKLTFDKYELGLIDDPKTMVDLIRRKDEEFGLGRIIAGYAWKWVSRKHRAAYDIELRNGVRMRWNSNEKDWITSPKSREEAGSIHTIQGYDLNYAGVIIGGDIRYDLETESLYVDRSNYFDAAGKANVKLANEVTTDAMLLKFICNIYSVLLTRGIRGTFIHVVDPSLREYLGRYFDIIG